MPHRSSPTQPTDLTLSPYTILAVSRRASIATIERIYSERMADTTSERARAELRDAWETIAAERAAKKPTKRGRSRDPAMAEFRRIRTRVEAMFAGLEAASKPAAPARPPLLRLPAPPRRLLLTGPNQVQAPDVVVEPQRNAVESEVTEAPTAPAIAASKELRIHAPHPGAEWQERSEGGELPPPVRLWEPGDPIGDEADLIWKIALLERSVADGRLEQLRIDRNVGLLYNEARKRKYVPKTREGRERWCADRLGMSYRRVSSCETLALDYEFVMTSVKWLFEQGDAFGFYPGGSRGVEFGLDARKMYTDFLHNRRPGWRKAQAEERRAERDKEKMARRNDPDGLLREQELVEVHAAVASAISRQRSRSRGLLAVAKRYRDRARRAEAALRAIREAVPGS